MPPTKEDTEPRERSASVDSPSGSVARGREDVDGLRERSASVDSPARVSSTSGLDDSRASIAANPGSDLGSSGDIPAPVPGRGRAATTSASSTPASEGEGTRPRSQSAPAGATPAKKPFETEVSVTHQFHEEKWVDLKAKTETVEQRLGDNTTIQGTAEAGLVVKSTAEAGISSDGLVAQVEVEVKGTAEAAAKIRTKIADMDATVEAKAAAVAKASAGARAIIGRTGVALEAEAKAETRASAKVEGGVQVSDKHNVRGGVEAEAYAKAKAVAKAKVTLDGVTAKADLSAGAGVQVGPNVNLTEGQNSVDYKPRVGIGKVGVGANVGVTNAPNNIGVKVKVGLDLGVGVEINVAANYNTEEISAAGRKAGEALQRKLDAFDGRPTNTHDDRAAIIHNATAIPGATVGNFGKELTEQGSRQGGVVGAVHQGVGYASQGVGYALEGIGQGAGALASGVTTGAIAVYDTGKSMVNWLEKLF